MFGDNRWLYNTWVWNRALDLGRNCGLSIFSSFVFHYSPWGLYIDCSVLRSWIAQYTNIRWFADMKRSTERLFVGS
jgi:hypothetical protein